MTSTPNGSKGTGQFFYDYWNNAIDSDLLFETDHTQTKENETNQNFVYEKFIPNATELVNDKRSNSFIRIKYPWFEDFRKTQEWYEEQCRELNFNTRKIGQEIDLEFVGSTDCPFSDEVLTKMQKSVVKPKFLLDLPHSAKLKIFTNDIDPGDYYLIGVDTASAINGCYSAIEVFGFRDFTQVAELAIRVGSLHDYGDMVYEVTKYFVNLTNGRVILVIENNSIGKSIVEQIQLTDMGYYLYNEKNKIDINGNIIEYGVNTNSRTKSLMTAELYAQVNENPENFKSEELVNQFHAIERNNAGQITSSTYSDMFMACCFCAYARKQKELDILPLLSYNSEELQEQQLNIMSSFIEMSNNKKLANIKINEEENIIVPENTESEESVLPFFF